MTRLTRKVLNPHMCESGKVNVWQITETIDIAAD